MIEMEAIIISYFLVTLTSELHLRYKGNCMHFIFDQTVPYKYKCDECFKRAEMQILIMTFGTKYLLNVFFFLKNDNHLYST